jgi:D-alanine-D-alanine ligase
MKIVVLAGGLSTERDVSFKTGDMVTKALRENGHQVILLDVFMGYSDKTENLEGIFDRAEEVSVKVEGIPETAPNLAKVKASRKDQSDNFFGPNVIALCQMADVVFMALHGENGENGKLQAAFDLFGIRYTGTGYLSSALAMNKGMAKQLFLSSGIPTPKGRALKASECDMDCSSPAEKLGLTLPCVVKPCCGGSSIGVSIAHTEGEFKEALKEAFRWEEELIIEEYVEGREFSVGVLDFKALPVIEIAPVQGFYDYKNKYKAGSAVETCPADLPDEVAAQMQRYAEKVAQVLGLDTYSRSDFLLNSRNEIFCLEANTLPGMTPTSLLPQEAQAVGMNFNELCEKIIELSLKKYN